MTRIDARTGRRGTMVGVQKILGSSSLDMRLLGVNLLRFNIFRAQHPSCTSTLLHPIPRFHRMSTKTIAVLDDADLQDGQMYVLSCLLIYSLNLTYLQEGSCFRERERVVVSSRG